MQSNMQSNNFAQDAEIGNNLIRTSKRTYLVGRQFWQKLTSKQMVFAPVPEK
jgi:hypothetical protein